MRMMTIAYVLSRMTVPVCAKLHGHLTLLEANRDMWNEGLYMYYA